MNDYNFEPNCEDEELEEKLEEFEMQTRVGKCYTKQLALAKFCKHSDDELLETFRVMAVDNFYIGKDKKTGEKKGILNFNYFLTKKDNINETLHSSGDYNYYELITPGDVRYSYFDIDMKRKDENPLFNKSEEEIFNTFKMVYEPFVANYYEKNEDDIRIHKYRITTSSDSNKKSLHIVDKGLSFDNCVEQEVFIKNLIESFVKKLKHNCGIDGSVYSKNSLMRTINSTKLFQTRYLTPPEWHKPSYMNRDDVEEFLCQKEQNVKNWITNLIKESERKERKKEEEEERKEMKKKERKMYPPTPVSSDVDSCIETDGIISKYNQYKTLILYLNTKKIPHLEESWLESREGWFETICVIVNGVKENHFTETVGLELAQYLSSIAVLKYDEIGTEVKFQEMMSRDVEKPKTIASVYHMVRGLSTPEEYSNLLNKLGMKKNKETIKFDYSTNKESKDFSDFLNTVASKVWELNELTTYIGTELCKYCVIIRNTGAPNIYVKNIDDETNDLSIINGDFNFEITYKYRLDDKKVKTVSEKFFKWFEKGNYINFRNYKQLIFKPTGPYENVNNGRSFNTWTGFRTSLVDEKNMDYIQPFLDLVKIMWPSDYGYKFFLNYCAHLIQRPYDKVGVVPVLNGEGGAGKGTMGRILMNMFNNINTGECSDLEYIVGEKNSYTEDKCFVVMDESRAWNTDMEKTMGKFKSLITDKHQTVRKMYQDARNGINCCNFMMNTNFVNCISFKDPGALRRWAFSEYIKREKEYDYKKLNEIADDIDKLSHIFTYLAEYKIVIDFHKGEEIIPETKTLLKARLNSGGVIHNFINAIEEGEVLFETDEIDKKNRISIQDLFYKYKYWCEEANERFLKRRDMKETLIEKGYEVVMYRGYKMITLKNFHMVQPFQDYSEDL